MKMRELKDMLAALPEVFNSADVGLWDYKQKKSIDLDKMLFARRDEKILIMLTSDPNEKDADIALPSSTKSDARIVDSLESIANQITELNETLEGVRSCLENILDSSTFFGGLSEKTPE